MLKFSANLGFLWTELSLPEAIYAAKEAGFDAVECHWPYDYDPRDIAQALAETGLPMLGLNTIRASEESNSEESNSEEFFGLTALPGRIPQARAAITSAIDYAEATGTRAVHVMAGRAEGDEAKETFVENLIFACDYAAGKNITILIEPINTIDVPGYFLNTLEQAHDIITMVARKNLKIMFDCYHVAKMATDLITDDVIASLKAFRPHIGHIQFASVPNRTRPDEGNLDYDAVFAEIVKMGWNHPLGAEYKPNGSTEASLGWKNLKKYSKKM